MTSSEGSPVDPPLDVFVHQVSRRRPRISLKNKKNNYFVPFGCFEAEGYVFFCRYGEKGGRVGFDGGGWGGEGGPHTPNFLFLWVTCVQFPLPRHPTTTSSPPLLRTEKRGTTCRVAVTRLVSHFGPPMDESRSPQHVGSEGVGGGETCFSVSSSGCCQCPPPPPPPPPCFGLCALCVCPL